MPPSRPGSASGSGAGFGTGPHGAGASRVPTGVISRYQILEKIGEGGMGALYLARDPAIDRLLAIKVLRRGFDTDDLRGRFAREARAAGRLRHPNIVTIFDVGEHDGDPFIAMEFIAGETLDELIRHGARLSLARRLKLIEELCDGLSYAHRAGIVHRDVKPANLIVDSEGILKILDFGIVRLDEGGSTAAGMMVGTVNYMSPEQVEGGDIDHRSDIFAVGLVAYELLTSRQAFPGKVKEGLFNRILNVAIEPVQNVLPQLDADVVAILEQALKRDPADRYQDLARMRNDLMRARQRIEATEARGADEMMAGAGETALVTSPGLPTPVGGTPRSSPALHAAERALEAGEYRAALTLAGRSAAIDPRDREASGIMSRAEAALLERGRALERSGLERPPSSGGAHPGSPSGSAAVTPSGAAAPSGAYTAPPHPLLWALAGAVVILVAIVAGVLVPRMLTQPGGSPEPARSTPAQDAQAPPPSATPAPERATPKTDEAPPLDARSPAQPRTGARGAPVQRVDPPPRAAPPGRVAANSAARPDRPPAPAIVRAGSDVPPPRRIKYVEPQYPKAALETRVQGTVRVELTVGRDGRVADARVVESVPGLDQAALAAVRRWEFLPTNVGGTAVPVLHVVNVEFAAPAPPARAAASDPAPAAPAGPPSAAPAREPVAVPRSSATRQTPAKPDPSAATAAIQDALRRYEAAWEARDAAALARVQQLSSDELAKVRATMAGAAEYEMQITVKTIRVDPDGRRATAVCAITRRFRPRIGASADQRTATNTLALEKRGDAWMIVAIR